VGHDPRRDGDHS
jgi:hypothetical protein